MSGGAAPGLRRLLRPLACAAPVRVFAVEGIHPPASVNDLRLREGIRFVDSPRSASVLLVAGRLPTPLHDAVRRVHDMLAHPRATVWWGGQVEGEGATPFSAGVTAGLADDVMEALGGVHRDLFAGRRASEEPLLPDEDPAPWRGVGPYGQGGKGMTGGVPYGRPMAERAADRDGLELDQLPVLVGPFFPPFPTGLVLDLRMQGDIIQEVTIGDNPFAPAASSSEPRRVPSGSADLFRRALLHPVPIAELELARARHHLRWLAHALRVHGLETMGRRALALAGGLRPGRTEGVRALRRALERTRLLQWSTARIGVTPPQALMGRGLGPVARAAGLMEDARTEAGAYKALDFRPIVHEGADAASRWRQRLEEIVQSLELAGRAGEHRVGGDGVIESPRGLLRAGSPPDPELLPLLPSLVRGMEWGDAVTTVVSLDLDLRESVAGGAETA